MGCVVRRLLEWEITTHTVFSSLPLDVAQPIFRIYLPSCLIDMKNRRHSHHARRLFRYKNCGGGEAVVVARRNIYENIFKRFPCLSILRSRHNLNCRGILLTVVICVHASMINKARSHASRALTYDMRNALCCQHTYKPSSRQFSHQKHSNTNVRLKKMRLRRYFVWDVGLKCLIACVVCFLSMYISNDFI